MRLNLKTVNLIAVFVVLATLVAVPAIAATTPQTPNNPVGAWCIRAVDGVKNICSPAASTGTCIPAAGTATGASTSSGPQSGGCCGPAGQAGAADSSI